MLLLRAVLAFLALPAVVAGIAPALLTRGMPIARRMIVPGGALLTVGIVLLLWCVRDFFVSGRGTLAPWDPPKRLVVVGLYRFMRNPMYVAVLTILAGWTVLYTAWLPALYTIVMAVVFHLRVLWHEEPWLRRQFGAEWETYARRTGRWLPSVRSNSS